MVIEVVCDRIATAVSKVISAAALLRCGKQMVNYHIVNFHFCLSKNRDRSEIPFLLKYNE